MSCHAVRLREPIDDTNEVNRKDRQTGAARRLWQTPKRVLVVEDDVNNRAMLHSSLESQGYACEVAEHGAAAAVRAKEGDIDLVITDHRIPVMDGLRLLEWLAATPETKDIPVILLTDNSSARVRARATEAGAYSVLATPCCLEVLLSVVARAITGCAPRRRSVG